MTSPAAKFPVSASVGRQPSRLSGRTGVSPVRWPCHPLKNRIIRTATGEPGLNDLCRGLKTFFAHAAPEVRHLAGRLRG